MKLEISDKLVEEIGQHGVPAYPNECRGALLRVAGEDGVKSLWALLPLDNRREDEAVRTIMAQCRSGVRSAEAVDFLRKAGFRKVWNLKGGILAWSDQVSPSVPKY